VKTVADKYRHAAQHNKHWWQAFQIYQHNLEWPWTPQKRVFEKFFKVSACDTQFKSDFHRNGWR